MEPLVYLAQNAGEVLSRRSILDAVWKQEFVRRAQNAHGERHPLEPVVGELRGWVERLTVELG